jgi:hypothetical protein
MANKKNTLAMCKYSSRQKKVKNLSFSVEAGG